VNVLQHTLRNRKGIAGAMRAWAALRPASVESRLISGEPGTGKSRLTVASNQ
jgi:DNA replication protein DnaC